MGSDQISGHAPSGDCEAITKICSDPTLRLPEDYKSKLASKQPVKSLCCKNPTQTRDHPSSNPETVTAPCYRFFIPSPFTTRWTGRTALGWKILHRRFYFSAK
jgi:hypothetical protein